MSDWEGSCRWAVAGGDLAALEAGVVAFRAAAVRARDACATGGLDHTEVQFAATDAVYGDLERNLLGVAVVVVRDANGTWAPWTDHRVKRAFDVAAWLNASEVWAYAIDARGEKRRRLRPTRRRST